MISIAAVARAALLRVYTMDCVCRQFIDRSFIGQEAVTILST